MALRPYFPFFVSTICPLACHWRGASAHYESGSSPCAKRPPDRQKSSKSLAEILREVPVGWNRAGQPAWLGGLPWLARRATLDKHRAARARTGARGKEDEMGAAKTPNRRQVLFGGAAMAFSPSVALAQATRPLKIGVMNDMSSVYADYQGIGSVVAAQLAVDDFSLKLGVPVEIVSADHQNKPDVGASIARRWF